MYRIFLDFIPSSDVGCRRFLLSAVSETFLWCSVIDTVQPLCPWRCAPVVPKHGNDSSLKQEGFGVLKGFCVACSLSGVHRDGASVPSLMSCTIVAEKSSWIRFPKHSAFET